jgi:rubrerythrin
MITLKPELAEGLDSLQGLRGALQSAIELEHSTIPPYLYALYSITPGTNAEIASLLRSVVIEEMTHMGLACNILNAIGGAPAIANPAFVPAYPGPLPGMVESQLTVPLSALTLDLVENVFMVIEEPEDPLEFPTLELAADVTIGQFYEQIAEQLRAAGEKIFTGDPGRQVAHDLGDEELVAITDLSGALAAIETIVEQGEGTTRKPTDDQGELAHYYRFAEIFHGHRLVPVPGVAPDAPPEQQYAYDGPPIPFDAAGVRSLVLNPTTASYAEGTQARHANETFNYTYTSMLKSLHQTFNGRPAMLTSAVGVMESCKQQALAMGELKVSGTTFAGPSFQYQPTNP